MQTIQEAEKQARLQRVFMRGSWAFYICGFVISIFVANRPVLPMAPWGWVSIAALALSAALAWRAWKKQNTSRWELLVMSCCLLAVLGYWMTSAVFSWLQGLHWQAVRHGITALWAVFALVMMGLGAMPRAEARWR